MKDTGSAGKMGSQAQRGSLWQGCVRSGLGGREGQALQAETWVEEGFCRKAGASLSGGAVKGSGCEQRRFNSSEAA